MSDFISRAGDSELLEKSQQFLAIITAKPDEYGLSPEQVAAFVVLVASFETSLNEHTAAQADALSKTQVKRDDRSALGKAMRQILRIAKANPDTTKAQIASFGMPKSTSAVASSATIPVGTVDTSKRLQHTIHFADESTPDTKRKPKGTIGCEIWAKIGGEPPTDSEECKFLTLDTKTPHIVHYNGDEAGKMSHYMLRWKTKEGESAWGETLSATITG